MHVYQNYNYLDCLIKSPMQQVYACYAYVTLRTCGWHL